MDRLAEMKLSGEGAGTLFAALTAAAAALRGAAVEANGLEAEMYGSAARLAAAKSGKASAPPRGAAFSWTLKCGAAAPGSLAFAEVPAPGGAFAAADGMAFAADEIMAQGRDGMFSPSAKVRAFTAKTMFPESVRAGADAAGSGDAPQRAGLFSRIVLFAILSIPLAGFVWMCIRFKWI